MAAFALSGLVYAVSLTGGGAGTGPAREVTTRTPALDPRPDPAGRRLAYVCDGALRVASLAGGPPDQVIADPQGAPGVTFGLPEFIAAEEMDRHRGYWWAPDGSALLVARVDETPVTRWHIADPAHPERTPAEVAYPAAGTPNAAVSLLLARLDGTTVRGPDRPGRLPLPGDGPLAGRARPAGRGAEPGPAHHADPRRAGRHRPGQRAARGHRPALAGDRPWRPGLDRGRPDRVDPGRAGHPPPGPRGAGPGARAGHPARPAGPRRAGRGRRHRAVPGVAGAGRGRAVELRPGGPAPGGQEGPAREGPAREGPAREEASKRAPGRAAPRSPGAGTWTPTA